MAEFNLYIPPLSQTQFRVLYIDPHNVLLNVVLIGPTIERNRQEQIRKIMSAAPSSLIHETGYVPNEPLANYQYILLWWIGLGRLPPTLTRSLLTYFEQTVKFKISGNNKGLSHENIRTRYIGFRSKSSAKKIKIQIHKIHNSQIIHIFWR